MKTDYFINYHSWALVLLMGIYIATLFFMQSYDCVYTILGFTGLVVFIKIIDLYWWKYPPFSWFFMIEDFSGTYAGKQECFIIEKKQNCKKKRILIDVQIVIAQTASTIHVNAFYKHHGKKSSSSYNESCIISKTNDNTHYQLMYHYINTGSELLDRHNGTCITKITKQKGNYFLSGSYYTDRQPYPTRGNFLNLERKTTDITHPF